jgi:drug/metabolite transporter (DMT)-like permease
LSYFLPLAAAVVFVFGALFLKRASDLGAGAWRTAQIANYFTAAAAVALLPLGGTIPSSSMWWQPPFAALLFFAGQILSLLALNTGDVTVATPVLGLKIVLVAVLSTLLIGDPVGARLWTAAALSTTAIALLNLNPGHTHRHIGTTILLAGLAAASYACFDVVVQKWSPAWGTGRFLPLVMGIAAVYSIPLRRFDTSREPEGRPYRPWLLAGAACFAVQGLTFITSVSLYRHATTANILYSSRGLWSVIGVWTIGHWFTNREQHLGTRVLVSRFLGAILLLSAILMVLTA